MNTLQLPYDIPGDFLDPQQIAREEQRHRQWMERQRVLHGAGYAAGVKTAASQRRSR